MRQSKTTLNFNNIVRIVDIQTNFSSQSTVRFGMSNKKYIKKKVIENLQQTTQYTLHRLHSTLIHYIHKNKDKDKNEKKNEN